MRGVGVSRDFDGYERIESADRAQLSLPPVSAAIAIAQYLREGATLRPRFEVRIDPVLIAERSHRAMVSRKRPKLLTQHRRVQPPRKTHCGAHSVVPGARKFFRRRPPAVAHLAVESRRH